jgi:hypothetical protein
MKAFPDLILIPDLLNFVDKWGMVATFLDNFESTSITNQRPI